MGKNRTHTVTQKEEMKAGEDLLRRVLVGDEGGVQMTEIHHITL